MEFNRLKYPLALLISFQCLASAASATIKPLVTVSGGEQFLSSTQNNEFPVNFSTYNFNSNSENKTLGLFGIFAGFEYNATANIAAQLGISYYHSNAFQVSGLLSQGVDPQSSDFLNFNYKVNAQTVLVEGKILGTWYSNFMPYASLGIGSSFNKAYGYTSVAYTQPFMIFTPTFANGNNNSFVYMIGIGVDGVINKNWRLGLGCRYSTLGKIALGSATINTTTVQNTLSQSSLQAQTILAQLNYVI